MRWEHLAHSFQRSFPQNVLENFEKRLRRSTPGGSKGLSNILQQRSPRRGRKSVQSCPKWVQIWSKMNRKWVPNGSPEASGRPWGAEAGFGVIWGSILGSILAPKFVKIEAEICSKIEHRLWTSFFQSGSLLGSFWGRFWGHFGVLFRPPARKADFLKITLPPTREHDFRGSGGVQNASKTSPEAVCGRKRAPRASWEALGLDFGAFGVILRSQNRSKNDPKSDLEI